MRGQSALTPPSCLIVKATVRRPTAGAIHRPMRVAVFTFVGLGLLCCSSPERKFNGGGKTGGAGGTSGASMEPAGNGGRKVGGIGGSDLSDAGQAGEAGVGGSDDIGEGGAPG